MEALPVTERVIAYRIQGSRRYDAVLLLGLKSVSAQSSSEQHLSARPRSSLPISSQALGPQRLQLEPQSQAQATSRRPLLQQLESPPVAGPSRQPISPTSLEYKREPFLSQTDLKGTGSPSSPHPTHFFLFVQLSPPPSPAPGLWH